MSTKTRNNLVKKLTNLGVNSRTRADIMPNYNASPNDETFDTIVSMFSANQEHSPKSAKSAKTPKSPKSPKSHSNTTRTNVAAAENTSNNNLLSRNSNNNNNTLIKDKKHALKELLTQSTNLTPLEKKHIKKQFKHNKFFKNKNAKINNITLKYLNFVNNIQRKRTINNGTHASHTPNASHTYMQSTNPIQFKYSLNSTRLKQHPNNITGRQFFIYTAGLANWGFNEKLYKDNPQEVKKAYRLIKFFKAILLSMFQYSLNNFSNITIVHYDPDFSPMQIKYLQTFDDINLHNYSIRSQVNKGLLDSQGINRDIPCILLDFSHEVPDIGIKKIYFGYFDEHRPETDFAIIKDCKFIDEISPNGEIITFIDKLGPAILGRNPRIFYSMQHSCENLPASITIPNMRTANQFGGQDPRFIYGELIWEKSNDEIIKYINDWNNQTANILLYSREALINEHPSSKKCRLCDIVMCKGVDAFDAKFPADKPNLCRICYNLDTHEKMLAAIIKYNPK